MCGIGNCLHTHTDVEHVYYLFTLSAFSTRFSTTSFTVATSASSRPRPLCRWCSKHAVDCERKTCWRLRSFFPRVCRTL